MVVLFLINSLGWIACVALGLLYPAACSIQAIETGTTTDDTQWLTYWLVYSVGTILEVTIVYPLFKWLPLYTVFKALGLAWLVLPHFKGAAYIYEQGLLPAYKFVMKHLDTLLESHPQLKKYMPSQSTGMADKLSDLSQSVGDTMGKIHSS